MPVAKKPLMSFQLRTLFSVYSCLGPERQETYSSLVLIIKVIKDFYRFLDSNLDKKQHYILLNMISVLNKKLLTLFSQK